MNETDLYAPVSALLASLGYEVNAEVKGCDICATKSGCLVVVEMKKNMTVSLLVQAARRQRAADLVYVAIPRPKRQYGPSWLGLLHLLKRLGLGLIVVSFASGKGRAEIALDPSETDRTNCRTSERVRGKIMKELAGRTGDYNVGGSCRKELMTAYKENAIHIACCLKELGSLTTRQLRNLGTGEKTYSILRNNFYGWFAREGDAWELTKKGHEELQNYPELVESYARSLDGLNVVYSDD